MSPSENSLKDALQLIFVNVSDEGNHVATDR